MDKQNYTLRTIKSQDIKTIFSKLERELVKKLEAKILRRKRVLKSLTHLLRAVSLYFSDHLSFQRLSDVMACRYGILMSDTAWRKQFLKAAPILLEAMEACQKGETSRSVETSSILGCASAYAIDATDLSVQGGKTTSVRIHTQYSISKHCCTCVDITDHHGGETLKRFTLHENAVYLADRAYGKTPQLAYALDQKADFLIRIAPRLVRFFSDPKCTSRISFPDLMQKPAFSVTAFFKYQKKVYSVRLVGTMIPQEKQLTAEKRVRRKAWRKQRPLSSYVLEAAKWLILVTSLPYSFPREQLIQAYRLRWQIELHFKRIKSFLHLRKIKRSRSAYIQNIVPLWLAFSFLLASLQLQILQMTDFSISDFNAFSLALTFFS